MSKKVGEESVGVGGTEMHVERCKRANESRRERYRCRRCKKVHRGVKVFEKV